ncbi:MAG TPA: peptide-methionine (R)-S-oxide reductase, partial [Vicinamibacterales bacterium]|nr:peptide-methionine (R)-S-oxide reductase [Vicinamibacterales bacterium]
MNRRQFFFVVGTTLALSPALAWLAGPRTFTTVMTDENFPVEKTEQEWQKVLTPEQYGVLRKHGTERAFTSPLNDEKRHGTFQCA